MIISPRSTRSSRAAASPAGNLLKAALRLLPALFAVVLLTTLSGCEFENLKDQEYGPVEPGDTTGIDTTETPTPVTLVIVPATVPIKTGETVQFTATVTGTTNTSVTWIIVSGPGTISSSGLYRAPGNIALNVEIVTVMATADADVTASATATLIITPQTGEAGDTAKAGEICFQRDVLPIFQASCAKSGCHDFFGREMGYALIDHNGIMRGVVPGNPLDSKVYTSIIDTDPETQMPPPPDAPLTSEQIAIIRQWILQDARNTICPPTTNDCDTINVTYSGTVRPILDQYCIGCHSGPVPPKGINLTQYEHVRTVALDGRLHGVTARLPGYTPMPYGGNKLPDCEIKQLEVWAAGGAQNN